MKTIACVNHLEKYRERLQELAPGWEVVQIGEAYPAEIYLPRAEVVAGWSPDVAAYCLRREDSALRWLQVWSAGVDHMPLELCIQKNILLTSANGVHANNISETVFGMMLALCRGILNSHTRQREGRWDSDYAARGIGEIHGKTMGILGAGAIGQETARIAKAFGMRVLGIRRTRRETPYMDEIYTGEETRDMLAQCDYIVNILPATPDTRGAVGAPEFAAAKRGAVYINVGRGATTDTDALMEALRSGQLSGAAVDVTDPEPLPEGHPLWAMDNVLITPHMAGLTPCYNDRAVEIFAENLACYIRGEPLCRNVVDYGRAY